MADRILFPTFAISAAGSIVSQPFGIDGRTGWSTELVFTGAAFTGALKWEISNSGLNWFDITTQMISPVTGPIVQPAAVTGAYGVIAGAGVNVPPAALGRLTLTWTSGAASALASWLEALRR